MRPVNSWARPMLYVGFLLTRGHLVRHPQVLHGTRNAPLNHHSEPFRETRLNDNSYAPPQIMLRRDPQIWVITPISRHSKGSHQENHHFGGSPKRQTPPGSGSTPPPPRISTTLLVARRFVSAPR